MPLCSRAATLLVAFMLLTACAGATAGAVPQGTADSLVAAATAAPTSAPTATPEPTKVPNLANDVYVAGVNVGGLSPEAARQKLEEALAPLLRPLDIRAGQESLALRPAEVGFELMLDEMIAEAQQAGQGAKVALQTRYEEAALRTALDGLAEQLSSPGEISVISDTDIISRSFVITGGLTLDRDDAVKQIDERLRSLGGNRRVTLTLVPDKNAVRPTREQLQQQIEEMAEEWGGVVGIYVYDLASEEVVASLNENTVFSGASVMKVPILLQSYINLEEFSTKQETWLKKMIVESDNLAANQLLAASMGGTGTEEALEGALNMTEMLKSLGLEHTYQYTPYEAKDYLNLRNIRTRSGPKQEGPPPFTDADPKLRTTPAEMSQVFIMIEQCSRGTGLLLEKFADSLTSERCQTMLDRLEKNGDHTRLVAGLPEDTRVAHKSGWIEDMQSDVGIVRSPGGDYLLAVYLYREIIPGKTYLADEVAAPVIAGFSRLVYTYYNPAMP